MASQENLRIQQELNGLLEQAKKLQDSYNQSVKQGANFTSQISNVLNAVNNQYKDGVKNAQNLNKAISEGAQNASQFGQQSANMSQMAKGGFDDMDDGFNDLFSSYGEAIDQTSSWGAVSFGVIGGVKKSFEGITRVLGSVGQMFGNLITGLFGIGKAILSIPFKIFNAFVAEANRGGGGVELWRQYEEVRKQFGDFSEDMSKNVLGAFKSMRGELANTGLSVYRVTGFLHERLQMVRELATEMGATFNQFGMEIANNAEAMIAYQKGLGQTGESMKALAQLTMSTGRTLEETLRDTAKFSTTLGKQFGVSQKVIARDVGEMAKDLQHFGSVGVREMSQLSVFARKLGAEFKELLGIVDKFDNFEDAADSAARLAQAFGINVDVMGMIKEQDPGKRIQHLRDQFFLAGKSIDKLTRQERNYLAQATGLEDQALNSVFAFENQAKSYDEIAQAGQTAEQQQITQAEAMERLSASIERMVKQGNRQGGFFDRFMRGFKRGIRWTKEFWGIMRNIRRSLWATEHAGRRVGRAFVKYFPGVKKFLDGVRDFFDPKKFRSMGKKVSSTFKEFFKDLSNPETAQKALNNLLKNLQRSFFGMVGMQQSAMGKIVEGFKTGFKAVGQVILSGAKIAIVNVTKFIKAITDYMSNPSSRKKFSDSLRKVFGADGGGGKFANLLGDLFYQISKQLGPATKQLWVALKKMFGVALDNTKKFVAKWWKDQGGFWGILKSVSQTTTGKVIGGVLIGKAAWNVVPKVLGNIFSNPQSMRMVAGAAGKLGSLAFKALSLPFVGSAAIIGAFVAGLVIWKKQIDKVYQKQAAAIRKEGDIFREASNARQQELRDLGVKEELIEKINEKEIKGLTKTMKLMAEKGELTREQISMASQAKQDDINAQIKELRAQQMEAQRDMDAAQSFNYFGFYEGDFQAARATHGQLESEIKRLHNKKTEMERARMESSKLADEAQKKGKIAGPKVPTEIEMVEDLGMIDQVKKLNEKEIAQLGPKLERIRQSMIGPGGIREGMQKMVQDFQDVDLGAFLAVSEKLTKESTNIRTSIASVAMIPEQISQLGERVEAFGGKKDIAQLPVVRGIARMVEASNMIRDQLSQVNTVNIRPKLENLGKALGLQGDQSLRIEHENFNVNVNVQVELNPNKLADAVVDTGKVIKSTKAVR